MVLTQIRSLFISFDLGYIPVDIYVEILIYVLLALFSCKDEHTCGICFEGMDE